MVRLSWTEPGTRLYEAGVDQGVLYPQVGPGIPWNGLISVNEAPSDTDMTKGYFDGQPYQVRGRTGSFAATIEAFTYPDEFEDYVVVKFGNSFPRRKRFGLSYRTRIGNDISGIDHGYKLHLVYNALATPSQHNYASVTGSADLSSLTWDISTVPIAIDSGKPSAHLIVDSTIAYPEVMEALEESLYGSSTQSSFLPQPNDVLELVESNAIVRIIDNGDGTWTAEGPDDLVKMLNPTTFQIDIPTAVFIDTNTYIISSY
jgi:hypothetical protein